jgi:hypothetical protein
MAPLNVAGSGAGHESYASRNGYSKKTVLSMKTEAV